GVEGNCRRVPEVDAGMLVEVLDFLPGPWLIAAPDFQLAQVRAGIGLTPTLGYGPCHHGGERTHKIVCGARPIGVAVAQCKDMSWLEASDREGCPRLLHSCQKWSPELLSLGGQLLPFGRFCEVGDESRERTRR